MKTGRGHILFFAPASIPVNGAEAIVNVKLLKLLISKGYVIDVISKKAKWEHYPIIQEEKLQESLASLTVIELDNKLSIKTLWLHLRAYLRFGVFFKGVHWAFMASKKAEVLIRKNTYQCIITKNYPSELVGYWVQRRFGIPWIATWNDPYPHERFPEPYGRGPKAQLPFLKRSIIKQMRSADAHVYPSSRLRDYMQSYMNCDIAKTFIIPHIVEPLMKSTESQEGVLKVCYIGSLDGPRQPWTTIDALDIINQKHKDLKLKVDFIGTTPHETNETIKAKHLEKIISVYPPVSYIDSLELLKRYDVALIIEAPCKEGVFLPSKVSDAMAAGLSIFAISPAVGVLNDLYNCGNINYFSDVTKVESIVEGFEKLISDYASSGKLDSPVVPGEYEPESVGIQYDSIIKLIAR